MWGDNCTGHNEPDVCGQLGSNIDVHLQTGLKRRDIALLGTAYRLIEDVEVLIDIGNIKFLIEGLVEVCSISDLQHEVSVNQE